VLKVCPKFKDMSPMQRYQDCKRNLLYLVFFSKDHSTKRRREVSVADAVTSLTSSFCIFLVAVPLAQFYRRAEYP